MNSRVNDSGPFSVSRSMYCASCNLQFFIKDFTLKGSRCPMLLQCGHSICETCIQQNLKAGKVTACQLCGLSSSVESKEQTIECFPPSMYLVGNLVAHQNSWLGKDKRLKALLMDRSGNFNYAVKEETNPDVKQDLSGTACEECSLTALWYCENCKTNFCEICWSRVHGYAKSLMKHRKTAISNNEAGKVAWRKCLEHESQDLEFYCKGCSTTVCSHCVILQHQGEGHCPITLKEKNVEIISNVKTVAEEAEKISKRMKHTLEKVKLMQSSFDVPHASVSDLEFQITRNFSQIHGILQLEEERLLKKLKESSNRRENCMEALRLQLEKQIEDLESLLRQYEIVVKTPQECDLTDLHRQLKEVQNLPCYLISQNLPNEIAKVTFDDSLLESLKSYCDIHLPQSEVFELRSGSDLPEGYAVEPLDVPDSEQNASPKAKPEGESSVSDIDMSSNCSSRDLTKGDVELPPSKSSKQEVVFHERKNYSVRVAYIKHPGEFYVTLVSQRSKKQAIDRRASQYANCSSAIPETVTKDEIYLVKYNVDKKWYRARVMEVFPSKKIGAELCVLVYYIDYGNTETVAISRLRSAPADMLDPPLAVKCKLFDCVPKGGGEWCAESTRTMEKILNNCTATMFVMKVHRHCLEVDLSVMYPDGQIGRDIVSVRDALLFLEFSSFVHGSKVPRSATALRYLHQCLPSVGETFDVVVTHVNSPADFYVQKTMPDISYLYKLTVDLQKYYSENLEKGMVYNPVVGMPCAALFSADQKWYRAKIVDIPGKKMVTVFYVDYGNRETIPWTAIRKLKEFFVKWPALALHCALAGVIPVGEQWNTQARSYLDKCVMVKGCRVHVHGRPKSKQKLKVLLYRKVNATEVCVNSLFVDMGCAVKPSPNYFWKSKDRDEKFAIPDNFAFKNVARCQEKSNTYEDEDRIRSFAEKEPVKRSRTFQDRGRSKLSAKKLRELYESVKKDCGEASSSDDADNEVNEFENIFKVKVQILSAESPSSIYVTFSTLMEEFGHLQAKLNEVYENSPPVATEWAPGDACAVQDSAKGCWYRGSVVCSLPNGRVKVFLKDVARMSSEPVTSLRELDPSFKKYASCAVKCHLANIEPPGEQWPSISSEYLLSELEKFKDVYMSKKGQVDNKSLPVDLWVQKIVPRGALEPSTKEWVTLNALLVSQGLAVPSKQKEHCSSVASNDKEHSDDAKELEMEQAAEVEDRRDVEGHEGNEDVGRPPGTSVPPEGSCWLPPEPLAKSTFTGMPTYVDYNAYIHVYDTEQDENHLQMICEALIKEYEDSKPSSEDLFWSPGQMCIARYHADNSWYRGQIVQLNEDLTYEVLFVDYGNVETCEMPDLRKGIKLHEIPILCRKFQLQGISPMSEDGKWPVAVIDLLHSLVVDKMCQVTVLRPSLDPSGPHVASLKVIEDDVEVGSFLVNQGFASLTCYDSEGLHTSDSDGASVKDFPPVSSKEKRDCYIPLQIPDDCTGFCIKVTTVKSENEFFANIVDEESPSGLKTVLCEFEKLQQILTDECHLQPLLEKLTKGQPCCCLHPRSNRWCRGEIESLIKTDNSVCIFYIDHGDKEFLTKDLIHECKSDWLSVPKMAVKFKLANVEKCSSVSKSVYMKALTTCLNQSVLFAQIISRNEEVLEVKLLTKISGPLAYQRMIDEKLMTFTM